MKDLRVLKMKDLEKIQKSLHFVWGLMAYEYMEEEKWKILEKTAGLDLCLILRLRKNMF